MPIGILWRSSSRPWDLDATLVTQAAGEVVRLLFVVESSFGFGELGMMVAREWRGRGVGTALVAAAIDRAPARGLHQADVERVADNESAIALYRKFGSWKRDGSPKHLRRDSGELWDLIEMGLLL